MDNARQLWDIEELSEYSSDSMRSVDARDFHAYNAALQAKLAAVEAEDDDGDDADVDHVADDEAPADAELNDLLQWLDKQADHELPCTPTNVASPAKFASPPPKVVIEAEAPTVRLDSSTDEDTAPLTPETPVDMVWQSVARHCDVREDAPVSPTEYISDTTYFSPCSTPAADASSHQRSFSLPEPLPHTPCSPLAFDRTPSDRTPSVRSPPRTPVRTSLIDDVSTSTRNSVDYLSTDDHDCTQLADDDDDNDLPPPKPPVPPMPWSPSSPVYSMDQSAMSRRRRAASDPPRTGPSTTGVGPDKLAERLLRLREHISHRRVRALSLDCDDLSVTSLSPASSPRSGSRPCTPDRFANLRKTQV